MGPQGLFGGHDPNRWEILHEVGSRGVSGGHDPTSWDTVQRSEFFPAPFFLHRDKDENGEELGGFEDLLGGHDPTSLEALSSPSFFNAHTF